MDSNKMNISVPLTTKGFYALHEIPLNINAIDKIKRTIGGIINKSAALVNLSPSLLATLIFVESPEGITRQSYNKNNELTYSQFIGYCQISTKTAVFAIYTEFKMKRMSVEEENYLIELIGQNRVTKIKNAKSDIEVLTQITFDILNEPRTNIFLGAMHLKQCIDKETIAGISRLDKAMVRYNKGYFLKIPMSTNTDSLLTKNIPDESKAYILKMFGSTTPLLYAMRVFT